MQPRQHATADSACCCAACCCAAALLSCPWRQRAEAVRGSARQCSLVPCASWRHGCCAKHAGSCRHARRPSEAWRMPCLTGACRASAAAVLAHRLMTSETTSLRALGSWPSSRHVASRAITRVVCAILQACRVVLWRAARGASLLGFLVQPCLEDAVVPAPAHADAPHTVKMRLYQQRGLVLRLCNTRAALTSAQRAWRLLPISSSRRSAGRARARRHCRRA
jgi:hypothetical protein